MKIERLNWICNLSNSKKQEEENQKSCQRLKHLSSHCIHPPRKNSDWLHLAEGFCLLCNGLHLPHWKQFLNSRIKSYGCFPERRNDDKSPSILISNTNTNTITNTNSNTNTHTHTHTNTNINTNTNSWCLFEFLSEQV